MSNNKLKQINLDNLQYIATGAAVLGTGGGGDPRLGYLKAKQAIIENGPVKVVSVNELDDNCLVTSVAGVGAPGIGVEKIGSKNEYGHIVNEIEKFYKQKIEAVFPIEAGGINSMIPIVVAANKQIPIIDVDAMGRAYPKVNQVTFSIFGIDIFPVFCCDEYLNTIIVSPNHQDDLERFVRANCVEMGSRLTGGMATLPASKVKRAGIKNILTLAHDIGKIIETSENPLEELVTNCSATSLFEGKIIDVDKKFDGGFCKGIIKISGINKNLNEEYQVLIQNENLVVYKEDQVICSVPDLICILDNQTFLPITTENLQYGQRVNVVTFPSDAKWLSPRGLEIGGPAAFDLDFKYEDIIKSKGGNNEL